jgi:site-specific DNA recombinase
MNIFYGRCSTLKQKNSISVQMDLVSNYCSTNDIVLDKIIIDDGVSGKTQNREGITEVMNLVKDNKVENLIVLSLSRFGRSFIDNYKSVQILKEHKTNFISLKENIDLSTPMGVFIFNIFSSIYELEISNLSERTSDTLQSKKRNGKVYSRTPFGFESEKGELIENEYEQKVLRKMYKLRNKGESYLSISRFLNRNNHSTKMGKKFTKENVYSLLKTDRRIISTSV